jgi:hypothetical protein
MTSKTRQLLVRLIPLVAAAVSALATWWASR